MGKFKAGLQASQEVTSENQQTKILENQDSGKPINQNNGLSENQQTRKPESQYSEQDMALVNVGGFKVPRVVREHWTIEAKRARTPISKLFRELLIERFGLPQGITEDDL